jgi:hypothetical protein
MDKPGARNVTALSGAPSNKSVVVTLVNRWSAAAGNFTDGNSGAYLGVTCNAVEEFGAVSV